MQSYYFGSSLEYIEAEYATSNRSTCRGCKSKIEKDQLRLGLILDDDHFNAKYWYHLKCFQLKPRHKEIEEDKIEQKIYNIDRLEEADYNAVVEHIKEELERLQSGKKASKKASKKDTKKETKKGTKKASKKGTKKKKKDQSESEEQVSFSQQSEQESSEQSSSEQYAKKPKKKAKAKSTKVETVQLKGYTESQLKQFQQLQLKYEGLTVNDLKQILSKNRQSKNGTKMQLAQRCADGKLLGAIPTCSSCGGGRLRFDKLTGIYTCPGYMEDTDFIHCNKKFNFDEVKRGEWVD